MSDFLLVVPPLVGHASPLIGVADELHRRGHRTAWAGAPEVLDRLLPPDAKVYPLSSPVPVAALADRPAELRGFSALKHLWDDFLVPLAISTVDDVTAAVGDFGADVVVADQQALAGPLAALRTGRPWVTTASTSAEFGPALAATPKVEQWRRDLLDDLVRELAPVRPGRPLPDIYLSPSLVLVFSSRLLAGAVAPEPGRVRFVGTSLGARPEIGFPWDRLRTDRPIVYVTLGTVSSAAAGRFLAACVAASRLVSRPVQLVVADPGGMLPASAVADEIVLPRVPQLDLLARTAAVICHAGHNTVCEALSQGVPLITAPIRDDQPVIAQQVADVGAGVRVRFGRATEGHLAAAIDDVLGDPAYARQARLVQNSLVAAGGAPRAARLLAEVAERARILGPAAAPDPVAPSL